MWASPQAHNAQGQASQGGGDSRHRDLVREVQTWPSPAARDEKWGGVTTTRKDGKSRMDMLDWRAESFSPPDPQTQDGEKSSPSTPASRPLLNPAFTCWLMGAPPLWTSPAVTNYEQLGIRSYLSKLRSQLSSLLGRLA